MVHLGRNELIFFRNVITSYSIHYTKLYEGEIYVELFVIADEQAESEQLGLEVCDTYSQYETNWEGSSGEELNWEGFRGNKFHQV